MFHAYSASMAITQRRKLLTAAVGVATVSYVLACGGEVGGGVETSGNLVAAGGYDNWDTEGSGGSRASAGSGGSNAGTTGYAGSATSGNLVAPPPPSYPPPQPAVDGGTADAGVASGDAAADAAPGAEDAAVDSGP
jgi:hypothetical protein